jgi:mannose-6-phosphate isomerase-like protein (cupin superfamily)
MSDAVRRVVTGHDGEGKAVFVSDGPVEPVMTELSATSAFHQIWGGDAAPHYPDDGSRPAPTTYFPTVGGFRFGMFTLPPHGEPGPGPDVDIGAAIAKLNGELPGMLAHMEPGAPGMHTTATIDFEVVLSGEVVLELDDGATVHLHPGDTVVQNGTRHRWSNPGAVPATLAVFICGAHHDRVNFHA